MKWTLVFQCCVHARSSARCPPAIPLLSVSKVYVLFHFTLYFHTVDQFIFVHPTDIQLPLWSTSGWPWPAVLVLQVSDEKVCLALYCHIYQPVHNSFCERAWLFTGMHFSRSAVNSACFIAQPLILDHGFWDIHRLPQYVIYLRSFVWTVCWCISLIVSKRKKLLLFFC